MPPPEMATDRDTDRDTDTVPHTTPTPAAARLRFSHVLRSEWIKLTSLRSTWITLAALLVVFAGFATIAAVTYDPHLATPGPGTPPGGFPPDVLSVVLTGSNIALLVIAVLGATVGAREYSSGMIRLTMATVPTRLPVLWAKLVTFTGLLLPVVLIGVLASFFAGMRILDLNRIDTLSISDHGVVRVLIGTCGYLLGLGLIGLALGSILRNLAGSIATVIGGVLFLPALASALLPDAWNGVLRYLPSNAANAFTTLTPSEDTCPLWAAVGIFTAWVAAAVLGAAVALHRRDV